MKKKIIALLLLIALLISALSGCSSVKLKSAEMLMRPPHAYKVDRELKEAFENYVNSNKSLKSVALIAPSMGDYRSAFVMHDIDMDGEEEALVFYAVSEESARCHVNILDRINGEWNSVEDFSIPGSNINFVRFVKMTKDNCPAIIVSHNIYESNTNNAISVYAINNKSKKKKIVNVSSEMYSIMENVDMDSDGNLDIFLISQDYSSENLPQSYASVLKMENDNTITRLASTKLDGTISAYVSVKAEKASDSSPMRIYVDAVKGERQMITEVIYWNAVSEKLITPMFDKDTQSNIKTRRNENLKAQDFDADGIIEIPSQRPFPGSRKYIEPHNVFQQMYITDWIEVKNETDYTTTPTVVNARDSYIVYYDDMKKLIGDFTVYDYGNKKTWAFKKYDIDRQFAGEELFSVTAISKNDPQFKNIPKERYIMEDSNNIIYFTPTQEGVKMEITAQKIKDSFKLFKE